MASRGEPGSCFSSEEEAGWARIKTRFPKEAEQLERVAAVENAVKDRLARKRRLLTSLMLPSSTLMKTLRVFIHHTVNEPKDRPQHEGHVQGGKVLPSWTLKIEGGIVDGDKLSPYYRLSQFFEQISLSLDKRSAKNSSANPLDAEWTRPEQSLTFDQEVDGFETTQMGESRDCTIKVTLHRRFEPGHERYRLSTELMRLLKLPKEERLATVEAALLDLIVTRNLYNVPRSPLPVEGAAGGPILAQPVVMCDTDLIKLFGVNKFPLHSLGQRLEAHLSEPDPVTVEYTVGPHSVARVVDLKVDCRHDLQARCSDVVEGGRRSKKERAGAEAQEAALDRQAQYLFRTLVARTRRLEAYRRLAEDPVGELRRQAAQRDETDQVLCESSGDARLLTALLGRMGEADAGPRDGSNSKKGAALWIGEAIEEYLRQQQ